MGVRTHRAKQEERESGRMERQVLIEGLVIRRQERA